MAVAKRLSYKDMTPTQKKKAEAWAEKWNMKPEQCPMTRNGLIVNSRKALVAEIGEEAYDIMALGYVDDVDDITEEVRKEYRKDMAECEELHSVGRLR